MLWYHGIHKIQGSPESAMPWPMTIRLTFFRECVAVGRVARDVALASRSCYICGLHITLHITLHIAHVAVGRVAHDVALASRSCCGSLLRFAGKSCILRCVYMYTVVLAVVVYTHILSWILTCCRVYSHVYTGTMFILCMHRY